MLDLINKKWGHDELQEDLAKHLRINSDRMVWTNMQLGPHGSARPDVYTLQKSYSKFHPIAYECKISVADFRSDITSGKWQKYLEFASGVIFAAPAGLIRKEDIPQGCGLIIRGENAWRSVKGPTLKATDSLPRDAWMKLLIDGIDRQGHQDPQPRRLYEWEAEKKIRARYGDIVADALSDLMRAEYRMKQKTEQLNRSIEELEKEERERAQLVRKRAEADLLEIRKEQQELATALGLPENAPLYLIQNSAFEVVCRLKEDGEVKRLTKMLESARKALDDGLKPIPLTRAA